MSVHTSQIDTVDSTQTTHRDSTHAQFQIHNGAVEQSSILGCDGVLWASTSQCLKGSKYLHL